MKYIFTFLFLFSSCLLHSQIAELVQYVNPEYYQVEVHMKNGDINKGYAEIPTGRKKIRFKNSESDKAEKIKCDDIDKIKYTANGKTHFFVRAKYRMFVGKKKEHITKKGHWYYLVKSHELLNQFSKADGYAIDKEGIMILKSKGSGGMPAETTHYFQRPGEDFATLITRTWRGAHQIGKNKEFRKNSIRFFDDAPLLQQRIEQKEFKNEDMNQVFNAYVLEKKKNIAG